MYTQLTDAVHAMADALMRIDTGETFGGFTCGEIEAIADVLRAAGRDDVARFILDEHAADDDEGDAHYQGERDGDEREGDE